MGDSALSPALFSARLIEFSGEEVMVSTVTNLSEQEAARDALSDANQRLVMADQRYLEMNAPCADKILPGATSRVIVQAAVDCGLLIDGETQARRSSCGTRARRCDNA